MKALHKSKSVSWPPDFKLCQVRLFVSEDSPSQVGSESQDHLQAKSSGASHLNDDNLPPGFGGPLSANESQIKLSDIPLIKWSCSVRILQDEEWRVVAGEESKEVEAQNQRELRVLEAFYPGSSVPPNPSVPADVENSDCDDQQTIVIPILPVEDDDITTDSASDFPTQSAVDVGMEPSTMAAETPPTALALPGGSEIMAALSAISNGKEQGSSMIDQDLLIKILSNPKLVESLVSNCAGSGSVSSNASNLYPSSTHEANGVVTTATASSNGQYYPQPTVTHSPAMVYPPPPTPSDQASYGAPPVRDATYYKNLIQQHGGERQEMPPAQQHLGYRYKPQPGGGPNPEMVNNNQRPRDSKPKIMKPCMYFNSSRGCRNGANCLYQHDAMAYQPRNPNNGNTNNPELQNAKRMRFDRD